MRSHSLEETWKLAADFIHGLKPRDHATVVALKGDLGAGKTSFAQGAAKALGIQEVVQSPTFVILKSYDAAHSFFRWLIHIDAYRLESPDELASLGWKDLVSDPRDLILIEWPERVAKILPDDTLTVRLDFINEKERNIDFDGNEDKKS